jgi:predicted RNA binding protein YcfA (HicA-like mRNA interferase family)
MSRLPHPRGRELLRALERAGFVVIRVRGSHHQMKHPDGRVTTVPVHAGEVIGNSLMKAILKQCEMSIDQINELL